MEKFTASNGISVMRNPDDGPDIDYQSWSIGNALEVLLAPHEVDALREFFLHEWDQELGRWRWPENPDVVVYVYNVNANRVRALSESTGQSEWSQRGSESSDWYGRAARDYFAAHPERKPWHDAKPGEVWVLTADGKNHPWAIDTIYTDRFVHAGGHSIIPVDHPSITAGRRIWPEVSDDV